MLAKAPHAQVHLVFYCWAVRDVLFFLSLDDNHSLQCVGHVFNIFTNNSSFQTHMRYEKERKLCLDFRFIGAVKDMSEQIVTSPLRMNISGWCYQFCVCVCFFFVQKDERCVVYDKVAATLSNWVNREPTAVAAAAHLDHLSTFILPQCTSVLGSGGCGHPIPRDIRVEYGFWLYLMDLYMLHCGQHISKKKEGVDTDALNLPEAHTCLVMDLDTKRKEEKKSWCVCQYWVICFLLPWIQ